MLVHDRSNSGVVDEVEDDSDFRTDDNGGTSDESGIGRRLLIVIAKHRPLEPWCALVFWRS